MTAPRTILFDVNETLLNMEPMRVAINFLLGSESSFQLWFGLLLQYSLVDNCTNNYHDFVSIAGAALEMAATINDKKVTIKEITNTLQIIKKLSPHPDVVPGLQLLQQNGYRLATLSNSPLQTSLAQLAFAKIDLYFEAILSVDAVKKYKPSLEPYNYAASILQVDINQIIMVAAHGWDIAGAARAGMKTAFINRPNQALYPLTEPPTYDEKDIILFAKKLKRVMSYK